MDAFIVCFIRIVYFAGVLTALLMMGVGLALLIIPSLLFETLRMVGGAVCIGIGITLVSVILYKGHTKGDNC